MPADKKPVIVIAIIIFIGIILLRTVENQYASIYIQNENIVDFSISTINKPYLATILEDNQRQLGIYAVNVTFYNESMGRCFDAYNQLTETCAMHSDFIKNLNDGLNVVSIDLNETQYRDLTPYVRLFRSGLVVDERSIEE